MNRVSQTMLVPHSAEQMYQLVNNYQRYPEFLPGCISGKTLHQQGNELDAELIVSKAGIRLAFTTHNTMQPNQSIQMKLVEGPFKHLNGVSLNWMNTAHKSAYNYNLLFLMR